MVENNTGVEYNLDEKSDCEGYKNGDIGNNESTVLDFDPKSLDIEVSSVGSNWVSSDHTDFRDELDDNEPNTVNDATFTANANMLTGQLTSLDIHNWAPLLRIVVRFTWKLWCFYGNSTNVLQPMIQTRNM